MTANERQAAMIADLEARAEILKERIYFLAAALAQANAELGKTDYATFPPAKNL